MVDNDPHRSAAPTVEAHAKEAAIPIRYASEPRGGIARVRNRLVDEAQGRWLAFIDDDEWPAETWLTSLIGTWRTTGADVVFGPVLPAYPPSAPQWVRRSGVFERRRPSEGEPLQPRGLGAGNFLCERAVFERYGVRFSETFDAGAEDSDVFMRLHKVGAAFVGSGAAIAFEEVPDERMRVAWWLRRAFRGGRNDARLERLHGGPFSAGYFVSAAAKAGLLSALLLPSCLFGRLGVVRVGVPWIANVGKLCAWVEGIGRQGRPA